MFLDFIIIKVVLSFIINNSNKSYRLKLTENPTDLLMPIQYHH